MHAELVLLAVKWGDAGVEKLCCWSWQSKKRHILGGCNLKGSKNVAQKETQGVLGLVPSSHDPFCQVLAEISSLNTACPPSKRREKYHCMSTRVLTLQVPSKAIWMIPPAGASGGQWEEPMLVACRWFDRELAGYIAGEDLEEIAFMVSDGMSSQSTRAPLILYCLTCFHRNTPLVLPKILACNAA